MLLRRSENDTSGMTSSRRCDELTLWLFRLFLFGATVAVLTTARTVSLRVVSMRDDCHYFTASGSHSLATGSVAVGAVQCSGLGWTRRPLPSFQNGSGTTRRRTDCQQQLVFVFVVGNYLCLAAIFRGAGLVLDSASRSVRPLAHEAFRKRLRLQNNCSWEYHSTFRNHCLKYLLVRPPPPPPPVATLAPVVAGWFSRRPVVWCGSGLGLLGLRYVVPGMRLLGWGWCHDHDHEHESSSLSSSIIIIIVIIILSWVSCHKIRACQEYAPRDNCVINIFIVGKCPLSEESDIFETKSSWQLTVLDSPFGIARPIVGVRYICTQAWERGAVHYSGGGGVTPTTGVNVLNKCDIMIM